MSIHEGHRARMRQQLKTSGMDSLSDVQVLELLLYYAIPRRDTNALAHALLDRFGSFCGVMEADAKDLAAVYTEAGTPATPFATAEEAVRAAMSLGAQTGRPIFALGSLYSYGQIRRAAASFRP